jgi:aspartokinase
MFDGLGEAITESNWQVLTVFLSMVVVIAAFHSSNLKIYSDVAAVVTHDPHKAFPASRRAQQWSFKLKMNMSEAATDRFGPNTSVDYLECAVCLLLKCRYSE